MENNHLRTEQLDIEKLVYGGNGLARKDGKVFFVPKTLPGEQVEAELRREKASFTQTRLAKIITPSPTRIPAPCPVYERCGGCHYQHLGYPAQLAAKASILAELLERAKIPLNVPIEPIASPPWAYRNRSQFHLHNGLVGFLEESSNKLVPAEQCPVSSPRLNEALSALRRIAKDRRFPGFLKSIEFFTNEQDVQVNVLETNRPLAKHFFDWLAGEIPGSVSGAITYPAGGFDWKVSYRSFFQVNRFLIDELARLTTENLAGRHAVDLYSGVGLFSLPLAKSFERVTAVESGKVAMYDLSANAAQYKVDNIRIVQANVEEWVRDLKEAPDVILADPPRSGLGPAAAQHLAQLPTPEIRLVSCDPATLVRDLAPLSAAGYAIAQLTLLDLFPQTFHIETVTRLVRS
ncbi:MAG: class I SAM-dependent RNA methyltransferase [Bryobacter sp.]